MLHLNIDQIRMKGNETVHENVKKQNLFETIGTLFLLLQILNDFHGIIMESCQKSPRKIEKIEKPSNIENAKKSF